MKYNYDYFLTLTKQKIVNPINIIVVCPYDRDTILAIKEGFDLNLINPILIGNKDIINNILCKLNIDNKFEIINTNDDLMACEKSMELLSKNNKQILMKGNVGTSTLLKTLLDKRFNLRTKKHMSHVCLSYNPNYYKFFLITDAAMNIRPDLETKKKIIENAVYVAQVLGIQKPYVANLCAKEKVYEKMQDTIDAEELRKLNEKNIISNCVVSGPLQIDLAIDNLSAKIKNIDDPVAGKANILVCPDITSANIFSKAICYLGGWSFCGIIVGAKIPLVLTSRSTNLKDKIISICLAILCIVSGVKYE